MKTKNIKKEWEKYYINGHICDGCSVYSDSETRESCGLGKPATKGDIQYLMEMIQELMDKYSNKK